MRDRQTIFFLFFFLPVLNMKQHRNTNYNCFRIRLGIYSLHINTARPPDRQSDNIEVLAIPLFGPPPLKGIIYTSVSLSAYRDDVMLPHTIFLRYVTENKFPQTNRERERKRESIIPVEFFDTATLFRSAYATQSLGKCFSFVYRVPFFVYYFVGFCFISFRHFGIFNQPAAFLDAKQIFWNFFRNLFEKTKKKNGLTNK